MLLYGFKTRDEVLSELRVLMRTQEATPATERRWSDTELQLAINLTLSYWSGAVSMAADYSLEESGPVNLPWYIGAVEVVFDDDAPIRVANGEYVWDTLRFEIPAVKKTATLTFPLVNGVCSFDDLTLRAPYTAGGTEMILDYTDPAVSDVVPEMGVLLLAGIWYAFVRGEHFPATTSWSLTILKALPRGQDEGASMDAGLPVKMGVFVPDSSLWLHLTNYAAHILHSLYSAHGSPTDIESHQWFMRWHHAEAESIWKRYKPRPVQSRIVLK